MVQELPEIENRLLLREAIKGQNLSKEFKSLKTIETQFEFWDKKIKSPYITFLSLISPYHDFSGTPIQTRLTNEFQKFKINPKKDQYTGYNNKLVEQYRLHYGNIFHRPILSVKPLIEEYYENLQFSSNKENFIKDKIDSLDNEISQRRKLSKDWPNDKRISHFLQGYEGNFYNDKEPDLDSCIYEFNELISLLEGNSMAEFKKFLVSESKNKSYLSKKVNELTARQQLMILRYLGATDKIMELRNTTKAANFFNLIICKSPQNIRVDLMEIETWTTASASTKQREVTKHNLEVVRKVFEQLGIMSLVAEVEADIKKLPSTTRKKL